MEFRSQIFASPGRYVQGAGAIRELGAHVGILGSRVLVVGGKKGLSATRGGRGTSFQHAGITQVEAYFRGETSDAEIGRLTDVSRHSGCDVIMASGGGKTIDAVKAAAEELGVPAVIVPTIASNDAPCSALSVIYHEDGSFKRLRPLKRNPALVLMDTEIIVCAPVRSLVAGMGDALATWFEADACGRSGAVNTPGGHISMTAMALARLCRDTLMEFGAEAKQSCENRTVTPAFEKVVEANTLLSGLGFESGGVAVAHALSEAFTVIPEMHGYTHGEKVAFGLLVQLIIDKTPPDVIDTVLWFCAGVGLPVTLAELGCGKIDLFALRRAAEAAAEPGKPSHNIPFPVNADMIYEAILAADTLGQSFKAR